MEINANIERLLTIYLSLGCDIRFLHEPILIRTSINFGVYVCRRANAIRPYNLHHKSFPVFLFLFPFPFY